MKAPEMPHCIKHLLPVYDIGGRLRYNARGVLQPFLPGSGFVSMDDVYRIHDRLEKARRRLEKARRERDARAILGTTDIYKPGHLFAPPDPSPENGG